MRHLVRAFVRFEPARHEAVELVRTLDIREMPASRHLLVPRPRHEPGEPAVLGRRRPGIVGAANHQYRHPHLRQARREIEIEDRGATAEIALRRRADYRIADLLPAAG